MSERSPGSADKAQPLLLSVAMFSGLSFGSLRLCLVNDRFDTVVYFSLIVLVLSLMFGARSGDISIPSRMSVSSSLHGL